MALYMLKSEPFYRTLIALDLLHMFRKRRNLHRTTHLAFKQYLQDGLDFPHYYQATLMQVLDVVMLTRSQLSVKLNLIV